MPDNNQDPWKRRSSGEPPDLLELFKKAFGAAGGKKSPAGGAPGPQMSSKYLYIIPIAIIVIWIISGFFVVNAQNQAAVTRFGRYVRTVGPGLHWLPRLVESEITENVQRIRIYNYRAAMLTVDTDTDLSQTNAIKNNDKTKQVKGDQDEGANDISIVVAAITVNYRIANLHNYLFNTADPLETLRQATSSALRQEVGHMQLEAVLSTQRELLREKVTKQLRHIISAYKTGIEVTDVTIQKTETPDEVRPAFLDVIKAQGEKNAFINMAEAYKTQLNQSAQGEAAQMLSQAKAYKSEVTNKSIGDVSRFDAMLRAYDNAPTVTQDRLYYDALQDVFGHTTNIVLDSKGNNVLYLPLEQILKQQHARLGTTPKDEFSQSDQQSQAQSEVPAANDGADSADKPSSTSYGGYNGRSRGYTGDQQ